MLLKDEEEHPMPEGLRPMFRRVSDAFVVGDYQLQRHPVPGVAPVSTETAAWIAENVEDYGEPLAPLDEQTWQRSIYVRMDGYWDVVLDLTTTSAPVSDLALHGKIYERGDSVELEIYAVYVP